MDTPEDAEPVEWENLEPVGRYATPGQAHEHALVALAMGADCWVGRDDGGGSFTLHVLPAMAGRVGEEIASYDAEQAIPARPPVEVPPGFPWGLPHALAWVATLMLVFLWQGYDPALTDWAKSSDIGLFERGEWWRPFTALFLHADLEHLLGNLGAGLLFGLLVARSIGAVPGWLLILASGTAGNLLTAALVYPEPFSSLGASTAVFGALGILSGCGLAAKLRNRSLGTWASIIEPLIGAMVLLAWLGAGGPRTDVRAHALGFAAGLPAGLAAGWWRLQAGRVKGAR